MDHSLAVVDRDFDQTRRLVVSVVELTIASFLNDDDDVGDLRTDLVEGVTDSGHRAAGRQQVVDDQQAVVGLDIVDIHLRLGVTGRLV